MKKIVGYSIYSFSVSAGLYTAAPDLSFMWFCVAAFIIAAGVALSDYLVDDV